MNKVILEGRVGSIQELKTVGENKVLNFSLATNDGYGDNSKTNWHNCSLWNKSAENFNRFIKKGQGVIVEGKIEYTEKDDKKYTQINCERFYFISASKSEGTIEVKKEEKENLPF